MPRLTLVLLLALSFILSTSAQETQETEILWDTWGVPHIFAPDDESLFYAFGWAQAHNHGDLILHLYGEARGKASEYWGVDWVEQDKLMHTLWIPEQGRASYRAQSPEWQENLDAFAQGINDYVVENPELIADEVEVVLPITPQDLMAHGTRVLRYEFLARQGINLARGWGDFLDMGSNAWAVAPSRSASGNAMLVANPHQPWSGFGLWIEAHFNTPNTHMYGAALVGNPVLGIAFNDHLGWTHTVNTHDGWDVYELTLTDPVNYLVNGETLSLQPFERELRVKQDDGTYEIERFGFFRSIFGPVLSYRPEDSTALALRVVGERSYGATEQWWDMGRATNLEEFESALSRLQIPMFTVMYADNEGNILHVFNEQIPIREFGDWSTWNNTTRLDDSHPAILSGDVDDYLWDYDYHPYEELPRILNPESGWLQNANEPPWTTTYPYELHPEDYPPYMAPPSYVWPRPQTSMRLLYEDETITFEELVEYKHSTHVEIADQLLPELLSISANSENELIQQSHEILTAWDRKTDAESVGAVLFALWLQEYVNLVGFDVYAESWDVNDPLNTPSGLSDPETALEALSTASTQLNLTRLIGGGLDVPYGDVFRLRVGDYDLPANGNNDLLGTFRVLTFVADDDLRFRPVHGDSYIAVVEFGETVRAEVLLSYGNATQPHSPHVGDQLTLFADKALRPALLTREAIEDNLDAVITLLWTQD